MRVNVRNVKNGYTVEVSENYDDESEYIYATKEDLVASLAGHVDEALALDAAEEAKKVAPATTVAEATPATTEVPAV